MKHNTFTFCLGLFFLFLTSTVYSEELIHVLQKGETLFGVSRQYNVPAEALMSFNNIDNPDKLKAGQKIRIPDIYTVLKGDTLYGIARKLNITIETLLSANKLDNNSKIHAGQTLYIPSNSSPVDTTPGKTIERNTTTIVTPSIIVTETNFTTMKPLEDPRGFEKKKVDASIIWPVPVKDISYLTGKVYGVLITAGVGEKVKAISSGTVISTGPYRGFGQVVFLQSKTGFIYVYGGLDGITPKTGQSLSFGDEIGTLGSDSLSGMPRLYFMVYNKDIPVDPAKAPRGY